MTDQVIGQIEQHWHVVVVLFTEVFFDEVVSHRALRTTRSVKLLSDAQGCGRVGRLELNGAIQYRRGAHGKVIEVHALLATCKLCQLQR